MRLNTAATSCCLASEYYYLKFASLIVTLGFVFEELVQVLLGPALHRLGAHSIRVLEVILGHESWPSLSGVLLGQLFA